MTRLRQTFYATWFSLFCLGMLLNSVGCSSISVDSGNGDGDRLAVGSEAPPLVLKEFLQGDPVDAIEPGQIYVIEFWGTWCKPCRENMPHLAKLQARYGERVKIIGVSSESRSEVKQFLDTEHPLDVGKTMGQVADYRIAIDEQDQTTQNYMGAAGVSAIPCAFLIDRESKISWIGHPADIDRTLATVVGK